MKQSGASVEPRSIAIANEEIAEFLCGRLLARLATSGTEEYPHDADLCHRIQCAVPPAFITRYEWRIERIVEAVVRTAQS